VLGALALKRKFSGGAKGINRPGFFGGETRVFGSPNPPRVLPIRWLQLSVEAFHDILRKSVMMQERTLY
jgi:hypothetical protein